MHLFLLEFSVMTHTEDPSDSAILLNCPPDRGLPVQQNTSDSSLSNAETLQLFSQLLDAKFDQKFSAFKRDLDEKEALTQSQLKKIKTETKAANSFKFKGNKLQFEFNTVLFDAVEAASKNITKGSLSAASAELERAKTLVNKRNKLIRFADKSPASWTAVEEYESDELAEDSEDEKKLRGAEKRALAKIREKKRKNVSSPAQATTTRVSSTIVSAAGPAHVPVNPLPFCQSFRGRQTSASVAVKEVTGPTQWPALVVFAEPVQLPQATIKSGN